VIIYTMNSLFMKDHFAHCEEVNVLSNPNTFKLDKTYQHVSQKYSFIIIIFHNFKNFLNPGNRIFQLLYNWLALQNTGKHCLSHLNFAYKNQ
jgi:hypothetical protein